MNRFHEIDSHFSIHFIHLIHTNTLYARDGWKLFFFCMCLSVCVAIKLQSSPVGFCEYTIYRHLNIHLSWMESVDRTCLTSAQPKCEIVTWISISHLFRSSEMEYSGCRWIDLQWHTWRVIILSLSCLQSHLFFTISFYLSRWLWLCPFHRVAYRLCRTRCIVSRGHYKNYHHFSRPLFIIVTETATIIIFQSIHIDLIWYWHMSRTRKCVRTRNYQCWTITIRDVRRTRDSI